MMRQTDKWKLLWTFLLKTALLALTAVLLLTLVFRVHRAAGNTMSPFVRDGDLCIFSRLSEVYAGDVVLYRQETGALSIGRIVAAGGQKVDVQEAGGYTIDGYQPSEEIPYETYLSEKSAVEFPLELQEDQVFILNDFRSLTSDGREWGALNRDRIVGKLILLFRRRGF